MSNSPPYEEQLAINAYWKGIGGQTMLPGTSRAADRFVRASYYLDKLDTDVNAARYAAAGVLSVQRNASAPPVKNDKGNPENSRTI